MRTEAEVAAMSCPVCRTPLAMSDRQGIEIDYCTQCRGVWLDRGELDKIIERSATPAVQQQSAPQAAPAPPPAAPQPAYGHDPRYDPRYGHGYGHKPYKRRKSWLQDIFD
jgi:Zn-finger nucleic acid-binding protein